MSQYDVAIIGGGAAGLSAALVLVPRPPQRRSWSTPASRATPRPATCTATSPATASRPPSWLAAGRQEVTRLRRRHHPRHRHRPGARRPERVLGLSSPTGRRISARRLLVTTGLHDELPDIPGLRDRWARDVLHCPYCHGHEVRDRPLGVIGGTPDAVRYAQIVRQWTHDLVYFTPPDLLTDTERAELLARAIGVVEGAIEQLVIDERPAERRAAATTAASSPATHCSSPPASSRTTSCWSASAATLDSRGWVVVDPTGRTSVAGVWAAGNVVDPRAQVITAAGAGSAAAIALNADLVERRRTQRRPRPRQHGFPARPPSDTHPKESP